MADGRLFSIPKQTAFSSGVVSNGGQVFFYEPGGSTKRNSYTTAALSVAHSNPVVADAYGKLPAIFFDPALGDVKYVHAPSTDSDPPIAPIDTVDNYPVISSQSQIGLALYPRTDGETSASVTPTNYQYEPGNVLRYGTNTTPGTTDMTTAIQAAIDSTADGNGRAYIPGAGPYLVSSSLNLKNETYLYGDGREVTVIKPAAGLTAPVITFSATNLDYQGITLTDFQINGDKAVATSTNIDGIYLDNSTGSSGNKARHILKNLTVRACANDGMYLGAYMRSSVVHDCVVYNNDGYNMRLAVFSDNQIHHMDLGQAGVDGIYATGCGMLHLDHIKSWYSTQHGFYFASSSIIASGLESQESGERGFFLDNINDRPCKLIGAVSDGDSRLSQDPGPAADHGLFMSDINGAEIDITITDKVGTGGVDNSVQIQSDVYDCNIRITATGQNGDIVSGAGIGSNHILVNGRDAHFIKFHDDFFGDLIADQWTGAVGSDGQCVTPTVLAGQVGGAIRLTTGNDGGGTMALNGSQLSTEPVWKANTSGLAIEFRVKISAITDVAVFVGFTDQNASLEMPVNSAASADTITTNASDAVGIMFDTAMATDNWWLVGVDGDSDATHEDSAVAPVAGTFETWRIVFSSAGVATFFRNGVPIGSDMSDALNATAALTPVVATFARSTTSRNIDVDFIRVQQLRADI